MNERTTPDKSLFSVDERANQYEVKFDVCGSIRMTFTADSVEDARNQADAMVQGDDDFGCELDEADEIRVRTPRRHSPMYRVLRGGKKMQVSYLNAGDFPRDPDERGF